MPCFRAIQSALTPGILRPAGYDFPLVVGSLGLHTERVLAGAPPAAAFAAAAGRKPPPPPGAPAPLRDERRKFQEEQARAHWREEWLLLELRRAEDLAFPRGSFGPCCPCCAPVTPAIRGSSLHKLCEVTAAGFMFACVEVEALLRVPAAAFFYETAKSKRYRVLALAGAGGVERRAVHLGEVCKGSLRGFEARARAAVELSGPPLGEVLALREEQLELAAREATKAARWDALELVVCALCLLAGTANTGGRTLEDGRMM